MRNYILTPEQRSKFQQLYLMTRMERGLRLPLILPGELGILSSLLADLMAAGFTAASSTEGYRLTDQGGGALQKFKQRYTDYLQMFDIYCAVDLREGEFAFEHLLGMSPAAFTSFLKAERWEDLRVAVAAFKGLDPLEIVFMSLLNEGQFERTGTGWVFDLLGGSLWDEVVKICNTNLHAEDLGSESVILDVINQGSQIMARLIDQATEDTAAALAIASAQPEFETKTVTETVTYVEEVTSYQTVRGVYNYYPYDAYYLVDPFYVAPIWYDPYWVY